MVCLAVSALLVVAVALVYQAQSISSLNRSFSVLVEQYGGLFQRGWLLGKPPRVTFSYRGLTVVVTIFPPSGRQKYTQVQVRWPDRSFRCSLYPERLLDKYRKFSGMQDIQVGDDKFDRRFLITGNDEKQVRGLLNLSVRQQVNSLYELTGNHHVYVSFSAGRLSIKKQGVLGQPYLMVQYLGTCLSLVDEALLAESDEIHFLETSIEEDSKEAVICQICGDEVVNDVVFCRGCRTPHHGECWRYYGSCSTYGCRHTRYDRPPKSLKEMESGG